MSVKASLQKLGSGCFKIKKVSTRAVGRLLSLFSISTIIDKDPINIIKNPKLIYNDKI